MLTSSEMSVTPKFQDLIYDRFSVLVRCLRLDALHYRDRLYNLVDVFLRLRPR